jgi:uncharacterized lipoprotein YbaY
MTTRILPFLAAAAVTAALSACGSGAASPAATAPVVRASQAAKAAPSPACTLKTTFSYIERDDDPGASVMANEIGNVDLADCASSLAGFQAVAGQAQGECATIALASSNPGYNVNEIPAPPLKDVIASAGPGC